MDTLAYLEFFNEMMDRLHEESVYSVSGDDITPLDYEARAVIREVVRKAYTKGYRDALKGSKDVKDTNASINKMMQRYRGN